MAANKKQKTGFETATILTGIVAIASILIISLLADSSINAQAVVQKNPCKIITCHGFGDKRTAENIGVDPFTKNVRCKCPNDPEAYYEVAQWKPYTQ